MKKNIKVSFMASVFAVALIGLFTSCEQPTNDALKLQKPTKGIYEFREISKTIELKDYHKRDQFIQLQEWTPTDDVNLLTKLKYKASLMAISGGNFKNYELIEVTRKATGNVDNSKGFANDVVWTSTTPNNITITMDSNSGDFTKIDFTIIDNAFPFDNVATAFYYSFKVFDKSKKEYHTFNTKPIATKDATCWKFDKFEIGKATFDKTTYSFEINATIISMDNNYSFDVANPYLNFKWKFNNSIIVEKNDVTLHLENLPNLTVDKPLIIKNNELVKVDNPSQVNNPPCEKVELSIYNQRDNTLLATKSFTKDEIKNVIK